MSVVLFTPAAASDIDKIWDYTAANWGEIQAAKYIQELSTACTEALENQRPTYAIDTIRAGYQKFYINTHVVFFRNNSSKDMEVIRILHQQMDTERHLN